MTIVTTIFVTKDYNNSTFYNYRAASFVLNRGDSIILSHIKSKKLEGHTTAHLQQTRKLKFCP